MFRKTLIATAAAALVSAGALGATTTPASATWNGYPAYNGGYVTGYGGGFGGNGWYFNFNYRPAPPPRPIRPIRPVVQKVCQPAYKTITVWDPWYGWVYKTVYAGQKCNFIQVYPAYGRW